MAQPSTASASIDEDDNESSQIFELASSIFEECKKAASFSDLDTASYLFREALDRRPPKHPLRSDSLRALAEALSARFSMTNDRQDLDQSIYLRSEVAKGISDASEAAGGQSGSEVCTQSFLC